MTTGTSVKERQRQQWGAAAAGWDRWFEWYSRAFAPLFDWMCDAVALAPGMRVLDVACGSGQPLLAAARRVVPGGQVVGIDLAPEMADVASRKAAEAGLDHVECRAMDAEHLEFEGGSFDAVTCACGLMFVPDVSRALAEMRRVARPGARVALAVWDAPEKSPFLTVVGGSVAQFFPATPPDPRAPGGFRFARPGLLESSLTEAGFRDVAVESRPFSIQCASLDEYWEVVLAMAAGLGDKVRALAESDRRRLQALVADAAAPYTTGGRLLMTVTPLCATARV